MHCGYCKAACHNRGGCDKLKAAIIRENEVASEGNAAAQDGHENVPAAHEEQNTATQEPVVQSKKRQESKGKGPADQVQESVSGRGRKRKPSAKAREQLEQQIEIARRKKSKQIVDENGDIDFPVIRTHIHSTQVRPHLDPVHQRDTMVHILGHEGPPQGMPAFVEPIPEESTFVAEHRANIPEARGPLVNTSGRALGRGTGNARGTTLGRARGRATGPTRGTTLGQARRTARGAHTTGRGNGRRGRLQWLLFGNKKKTTGEGTSGQADDGPEEVDTSQGAPDA